MKLTQLTQLRARHAFLVDKKFLEGLTPQEANELSQINRVIDDAEARYYEPAKEALTAALKATKERER